MQRVNVVLAHEIDPDVRGLGDFATWDEAEAEVARRCGGSLPRARPVPTNTDEYTFTHVGRIVEYVSGQDVYRVTLFLS